MSESPSLQELYQLIESLRSEVSGLREQVDAISKSRATENVAPHAPKVFCLQCHADLDSDADFCEMCGTPTRPPKKPLPPPAPAPSTTLTPAGAAAEFARHLPASAPTAATVVREPILKAPAIDWERFMGVKLFAWVGGFALFLGVAFLVKYSFDNNLISPQTRVAMGLLIGIGTIVGGLMLKPKGYRVTVETLCAAGIAILYADVFSSRAVYGLIPAEAAFALMVLVTATSFILSVRLESRYVALLGMIGGFLTPALLSTGVDRPIALFSYITLLDAGVAAVALRMNWAFLMPLAAGFTFWMEVGWIAKFFTVEKEALLSGILVWFSGFFMAVAGIARQRGREDSLFHRPAAGLPLFSLGVVAYMLGHSAIAGNPGLQFSVLLLLSLQLTYGALRRDEFRPAYVVGGLAAFLILFTWTSNHLRADLLTQALAAYLAFGFLHAAAPALAQHIRPDRSGWSWGYAFPGLMLGMVVLEIASQHIAGFLVWPVVLGLGLLAVTSAWLASAIWAVLLGFALVVGAFAAWMLNLPDAAGVIQILPVLAAFTLGFVAWTLIMGRKWPLPVVADMPDDAPLRSPAELAAAAALMPFLLLAGVCAKLPLKDPSQVFGLMLLLDVLLLGIVRFRAAETVAPVALFSTFFVELCWHMKNFSPDHPLLAIGWYLGFYALFLVFPFVFRGRIKGAAPWVAAALAGPLAFPLVYRAYLGTAGPAYAGLVPAFFVAPSFAALFGVNRAFTSSDERRLGQLAFFGGVALLFVTLIIPFQFSKEWITFGWGLEGFALVWLYSRVPHPGLKMFGSFLLGVAFVRLALNPAVLSYHQRSATPLWNWYLLVYGAVAACQFLAAPRFSEPDDKTFGLTNSSLHSAAGAILLFLLLNIEIADFFSPGATITFDFSGSLSQDMTYSLAWAVFAIGLIMIGIRRQQQSARYAGLGLLVVTIIKVFLHDLWRLGQLYRIASIIGLAVALILVSFFYQKFLSVGEHPDAT